MRDNELVIGEWSPIHLRTLLQQWFWKPQQQDCFRPRSVAANVLPAFHAAPESRGRVHCCNAAGSTSRDFFGLAQGKEADRYLGFTFGIATMSFMDGSTLLISPEAASGWQTVLDEERRKREETIIQPGQPELPVPGGTAIVRPTPGGGTMVPKLQRRFYASLDMEPHGAKMRFGDVVDNIIQHLAERTDTRVTINIEIQAESASGFHEDIQRVLKENASTLKFRNAAFEE